MVDPLAIVGVITAVSQLTDFSSRILHRLDELRASVGEVPGPFRDVKAELALLQHALRQAKVVIDSGSAGDETKKVFCSVVLGCQEQITQLDTILAEAIPDPNESRIGRGRKAISRLSYEKEVRRIAKNLQHYRQTLESSYVVASSAGVGTTPDITTSNQEIRGAVSTSNKDVEDLRRRFNDLESQVYQQSHRFERAQADSNTSSQSRLCYTLAAVVFLVFSTSLALALWWSISHHDVSGGFTMGAYIIATAGLPIGVVGYRHSHNCRCWVKSQDGQSKSEIELLARSGRPGGTNDRDEDVHFRTAS